MTDEDIIKALCIYGFDKGRPEYEPNVSLTNLNNCVII